MIIDPQTFSLFALALSLASLIFTVLIYIKVSKFFKNGSKTFQDTAEGILGDITEFKRFRTELERYIGMLEKRVGRSMQIVFSKRYNPFKGVGEGGLQSHSTALMSENGDGVIISTLATRDRINVFSKPLNKFASTDVELTPEEKEVLADAKRLINP